MTLKEAIERALQRHGGVLTAEEISRVIQQNNLFRKGDGAFPDPSYVLYGVKNYLDKFEVTVKLRK